MAKTEQERIEQLLREGLDHYGIDEVAGAIQVWERVLELDPSNADALDYIRTADQRSVPRPKKQLRGDLKAALEEARAMMRGDRDAAAYELLQSLPPGGTLDLDFEATIDLARSRLCRSYSERVVDMDRQPYLTTEMDSLENYDLPPDAGLLLSAVDGATSVAELISLSGTDAFETLHILNHLLDTGILELPPT
jgi:hypothetical protein